MVGSELCAGLCVVKIRTDDHEIAIQATIDTFEASNTEKTARIGEQTREIDFPS